MENIFIQMYLATIKKLSPQVYNGLQILLVIKGSIQIDINQNNYCLTANDFLLINCHEIYTIKGDESNVVLVLRVPFEYMQKECDEFLQYTFSCYSAQNGVQNNQKYNEIRKILIHMLLSYSRLAEGYKLDVRANLFQLLHYLLINYKLTELKEQIMPVKKKDQRILSILNYIHDHYRQNITLEFLAKKEFVSVHYLSKLFKKQIGIGFLDYMNKKRLESAIKDLMYTDNSIIKIALLNGFANSKSFSNAFKKQYNVTPNQFKHNFHHNKHLGNETEFELLTIDELGGFPQLVKYIQFFDHDYQDSIKTNILPQTVSISLSEEKYHKPIKTILSIGQWSNALLVETQNQLNFVQKRLFCHYVHFQGIFADGIFQYGEHSLYHYYDYNQIISYFQSINLLPFIRINLSDVIRLNISVIEARNILTSFLEHMSKHFSSTYVEKWLFEVVHLNDVSEQAYFEYYKNFYQCLKQFSHTLQVGIFSIFKLSEQQLNTFKNKLSLCIQQDCAPDFVTFKVEPNMKDDSLGMSIDSHKNVKGYHVMFIQNIQNTIAQSGLSKMPLYAIEWNTIAGKSLLEVRSFYRSALILKAMIDMSEYVEGVSFWLNEQISERMFGIRHYILSLYHCFQAKRPAFYILQAFTKLGSIVLFHNEYILVTKNQQGDFVIVMSNPCYFNPIHAMDYNYIDFYQKKIILDLKDMDSGLYRFKVFHFKMNFSFAINSINSTHGLSDVHSYKYNDEDMLARIENIASPEFSVYEKQIEKTITLKYDLSFNAVTLCVIRKL